MLASAVALALAAGSLEAQKPKQKAPSKKAPEGETCTTTEPGRVECRKIERTGIDDSERGRVFRRFAEIDSAAMRRPALGMQLSATGSLRDTLGVFVNRVTPKGPAENAGIVEGDRIAAINGVDLRISAADVDDNYTNGLPSHRLTREVQKLTPGSRVNLRVYSGGRFRDVQVIAGRASDVFKGERGFGFELGGPGMIFHGGPPADMRIFRDGMPMEHMFEHMPMDRKHIEEMRLMPGMEKLENLPETFRMLEPLKAREMHEKIRSIEPMKVRSFEPLMRTAPEMMRLGNRRTIRI